MTLMEGRPKENEARPNGDMSCGDEGDWGGSGMLLFWSGCGIIVLESLLLRSWTGMGSEKRLGQEELSEWRCPRSVGGCGMPDWDNVCLSVVGVWMGVERTGRGVKGSSVCESMASSARSNFKSRAGGG